MLARHRHTVHSSRSQPLSNPYMIKCYHTGFCRDIPQKIFMHSHGQFIFRIFLLRAIFWAPDFGALFRTPEGLWLQSLKIQCLSIANALQKKYRRTVNTFKNNNEGQTKGFLILLLDYVILEEEKVRSCTIYFCIRVSNRDMCILENQAS